MKSEIVIALAGAVLLSCASVASASLLSSAPPKAGDSLSLSNAQQHAAWNDLSRAAASKAPTDFAATTSSAIPSTLRVRAVPAKTAGDVPALQPYDYARIAGKLLIVNPHDMMIAAVIAG
jgi:hypothetical protein